MVVVLFSTTSTSPATSCAQVGQLRAAAMQRRRRARRQAWKKTSVHRVRCADRFSSTIAIAPNRAHPRLGTMAELEFSATTCHGPISTEQYPEPPRTRGRAEVVEAPDHAVAAQGTRGCRARLPTTGWHRSHARKALTSAVQPKVVSPRSPRPRRYGPDVIAALTVCWTVLGMPAGKRLAPMLGELVMVLRHFGELVISDATAALLVSMSAATIDRRLAPQRRKQQIRGRATTKPGSLLKSQIPVRTWADWDDARPGASRSTWSHDGGNLAGPFAFTLTVTDIATGWTENRSVPSKAATCVFRALKDIAAKMPFPILGVDSDNGSEFINMHLLQWCQDNEITFTRARPANKNDNCHVEQKNWAVHLRVRVC